MSSGSLAHRLITRGFWLYFFLILMAPSSYVTRILAANTLSVADVGVLYSIIGFLGILTIFNDGGLSESINFFLPKFMATDRHDDARTIVTVNIGLQVCTGIIMGTGLWYASDYLALHYFHASVAADVLRLFSVYILVSNLYYFINNIFSAFQNAFLSKFSDFLRAFLIMAITWWYWHEGSTDIVDYARAWLW